MFSNFSRRQLLRLLASLIAGATAVGSVPVLGRFFASKAQAQGPKDKSDKELKKLYKEIRKAERKGRVYEVRTKVKDETPQTVTDVSGVVENPYDEPVELFVDDKKVNMVRNKKSKKYETYQLPFNDFESPDAVAETMIDLKVAVPIDELDLNGEF